MADPVLVLGATGTQGGAVARELLAARFGVRALVRDPLSDRAQALSAAGASLVAGDLHDKDSLARAFAGVQVVYAITTPFEKDADDELRQGENIIAAAQRAGLPWLILASVAAAARAAVPHFRSKARIEQQLLDTDIAWTVIAPSYFYENVLGARAAIREGRLPIALPADKPLHQVALADLGALVVAVVNRRAEHLAKRVEVAGDAPTPQVMAAAIGVRYEHVPLAELSSRSADLAAMYEFLAHEGYGIDTAALRAHYPEVPWTSFTDWAQTIDWR
ncbi:MAG: NmrA family NAD(P)-binding protein [Solirubrobacteraceae bacterium]